MISSNLSSVFLLTVSEAHLPSPVTGCAAFWPLLFHLVLLALRDCRSPSSNVISSSSVVESTVDSSTSLSPRPGVWSIDTPHCPRPTLRGGGGGHLHAGFLISRILSWLDLLLLPFWILWFLPFWIFTLEAL